MSLLISEFSLLCALGENKNQILSNLVNSPLVGMKKRDDFIPGKKVCCGVCDVKTDNSVMRAYTLLDCLLAQISIEPYIQKYGAERIGIVIGECNAGTHEAMSQYIDWQETGIVPNEKYGEQIEIGSCVDYLQKKTGIEGPIYVVSTACSSSAKVFKSAQLLLENNVCDAVLVGGIDALCRLAENGFYSLSALSEEQCLPFSKNRTGINLGEGGALFWIERENEKAKLEIAGIGESSDAYHLTSPDPEGVGAKTSMKMALEMAEMSPAEIDYINLHGTGTIANDLMEGKAVHSIFGNQVLCASTKSMTGHTLGACGAVELALSCLMIEQGIVLPHLYDGMYDKTIPAIHLVEKLEYKEINSVLSNSFAFGGSNASLIVRKIK